jgi:hypothetical protein
VQIGNKSFPGKNCKPLYRKKKIYIQRGSEGRESCQCYMLQFKEYFKKKKKASSQPNHNLDKNNAAHPCSISFLNKKQSRITIYLLKAE